MTDSAYIIRAATGEDEAFLWEMLYQAIFVPEGGMRPPREIINTPELSRYVCDWGRAGDIGFIAIAAATGQRVGAAWLRLMTKENPGYGYVDDETPELSIAVLPEHRGQGIGTEMLSCLLEIAEKNHRAICLSVSTENPAVRLYERASFEIVGGGDGTLTMKRSNSHSGEERC
jgi:ribosomal protein S18 acetylase RimI-like enzyme